MNERLSDNFRWSEFRCKGSGCCGGAAPMSPVLIAALEQLRTLLGNQTMIVDSGFRCPTYNATVKNSSPRSQHMMGRAADIRCIPGMTVSDMALQAASIPEFAQGGIGVYDTFLHVDVRPNGPWRGGGV